MFYGLQNIFHNTDIFDGVAVVGQRAMEGQDCHLLPSHIPF